MPSIRNLAILIFDDVEVLDFCGPFEVFSVANRFADAFNVFTIAEKGPVTARNGLSVNPHCRLADCPQPDILLVPGGQGTRAEMHNTALIEWIEKKAKTAELVLSVHWRVALGQGQIARRAGGYDSSRCDRLAA